MVDMGRFLECYRKKIIGKPCEGEPHARFEVAGNGIVIARHCLTLPKHTLVVGNV